MKRVNKKPNAAWAYSQSSIADPNIGGWVATNDLGASQSKTRKEAHTCNTKFGMGNHYGTGDKNKMGRVRSGTVGYKPATAKQLGTPPRSVV